MLTWLKNLFGGTSVPTEPTLKADYENAVNEEKVEEPKSAPKKKRAPAKKKAAPAKASTAPKKRGRPKKDA